MYMERWKRRRRHCTTFRTCLFGLSYKIAGAAKQSTLFDVRPLGGSQIPCVFKNFRGDVLQWDILGYTAEATSDLSIL